VKAGGGRREGSEEWRGWGGGEERKGEVWGIGGGKGGPLSASE